MGCFGALKPKMTFKMLLKPKINSFSVEIAIEFIVILIGLASGLSYVLGSAISPRTKNLKAEIKYLEGKYHRLRQDKSAEQEDQNQGFNLSGLLGGDVGQLIAEFVKNNPEVIQNLLGGIKKQNNINDNFSQGQLR